MGQRSLRRRRMRWLGTGAMALVVLSLMVATIGPSTLFGDRTFATVDVLRSIQPWQSYADEPPHNPLAGDPVNGGLPRFDEARERLAAGDVPLWTTYLSTGAPFLSLPQNGLLSPQDLPYLILPLTASPAWSKLLEGLVAVGLMYLFLRRLGVSRVGALLGSGVYFFTGFQIVWQGWSHGHVGALIPGLFWSIEHAVQERDPTSLSNRAFSLVPLAIITGWMWLEGFPAVTLWALQAAGIYALVRVWATRSDGRRRAAWLAALAAAVVIGTALAAVQLVPFADWLSGRDVAGRSRWATYQLPLEYLATAVAPNAFGSLADNLYYGAVDYIESQSFVGVGALMLAVAAVALPNRRLDLRRGARTALAGLATFVAVIIYVDVPLLDLLSSLKIPPYGTNSVGRQRAVLGALTAALAGVGWDTVRARPVEIRRHHVLVLLGVSITLAGTLAFGLSHAHDVAAAIDRTPYFWQQLRWPFAALIGTVAGLGLVRFRARVPRALGSIVLSMSVLMPGAWLAGEYWARPPDDAVYPVTPAHSFLQENLGHDRFVSAGRAMDPGTNVAYRIRSVTSHGFHPPEFIELLEKVDPDAYGRPTFPMLSHSEEVATSSVLDRLGARYFVTSIENPAFGEREAPPEATSQKKIHTGKAVHVPPPTRDTRAISVQLLKKKFGEAGIAPWLRIRVFTDSDKVLASGMVRMRGPIRGGLLDVPIIWRRPGVPSYMEIGVTGEGGWVLLGAVDAQPVTGTVRATDDGLELAFAEGVAIYRRKQAQPRFRWASRAKVVSDPGERLTKLASGLSNETVLLRRGEGRAEGGRASVEVVRGGEDLMRFTVDADGDGYLVIADTLADGWTAELDGEPVQLLSADHAFKAVAVPEGTHDVRLRYRPRSLLYGTWISTATASLLLGVAGWGAVGRLSIRSKARGRPPGGRDHPEVAR